MRRSPFIVCAFIALTLTCTLVRAEQSAEPPTKFLKFYVVYTQPGAGLVYYDTKPFLKLGYIATKPDLVWTSLQSANVTAETIQDAKLGPDGHLIPTGTHKVPDISLGLTPEESNQFFKLTTLYKGKKTLLLLGDTPLIAPMIDGPINTPMIRVTGNMGDPNKLAAELQTLVKNPKPSAPASATAPAATPAPAAPAKTP
jgi:hypothetical protein